MAEHSHPGAHAHTTPIRVAVVDEYPAMLGAVADSLEPVRDFDVVLRCTTGTELLGALTAQPCDVVVIEPWLRSGDGLDAIRQVMSAGPDVTVVAFSRTWDENRVNQVMALGARAYVPKSAELSSLPDIIHWAMDGLVTRPTPGPGSGLAHPLTPREVQVLGLAADGLDNAEISRRLFVTERTVKFHLQNAYRKLGAHSRTEASAIARRAGILS